MLKRIISLSMFIIVTGASISAQALSIGPEVGANFTTISNTPLSKTLPGLAAGVFANYSINEHLGVNVKALFSQMGTGIENSDYKVRLNYVQIPVSIVYFFGNIGNKFRPKLFVGPYVSFLLSAKDNQGNNIVLPNGNPLYSKTDFGALIGTGFNYSLGSRTWLNIDAAYNTSFSGITDVANSNNRNSGFRISAGLSFPIGE